MKRIALLLAAMCFTLLAGSLAFGTTLTIVAPALVAQQYQQTYNSPCIFGDPSCKQPAGFGDPTSIAGGGSPQNWGVPTPVASPTYTGTQIMNAIGSYGFIVGIDVNQAGSYKEPTTWPTLTYFDEYINGGLVASYGTAGATTGGTALNVVNNGNGYADDLITGFVAPTLGTDTVTFHLTYLNATDGTEEFFLVNTASPPPTVPEPASLTLFGTGLASIAGIIRKRRKLQ